MTSKKIITDIVSKSREWESVYNINSNLRVLSEKIITKTSLNNFLQNNNQIELSISLVSDSQMRRINKQFRNRNKTTNTLSFPAFDSSNINFKKLAKSQDYLFIGDIIFSLGQLRKEVQKSYSKTFNNHLTHLLTHSILHLIGHDHLEDQEAEKMESLEVRILKSLKIPNPYDNNC